MIRCTVNIINTEFFTDIIKDKKEAFNCSAISLRSLTFNEIPRVGDFIMFPKLSLLSECVQEFVHSRVQLEVRKVIINPIEVTPLGHPYDIDCSIPDNESEIVLIVNAVLIA
jgi:hypothetical protein